MAPPCWCFDQNFRPQKHMSEFTRTSNRLAEIAHSVHRLIEQKQATQVEEQDETTRLQRLTELEVQLGDIQVELTGPMLKKVEIFTQRMGEKDPVTQAPRYGPNMQTKVTNFVEEYNRVKNSVEAFAPDLTAALEAAREAAARDAHEKAMYKAEEDIRRRQEAEKEFERQAEQLEEERRKLEEEGRSIAEIARQAEEIRRQREINRQKIADAKAETLRQVREHIDEFNNYPRGVNAFGDACAQLIKRIPDSQARDIALSTLHSLISNILSKPDEDTFRRIRPSHPVLQTKLTQWEEANLCFAALSFRAQLEDGGTDMSNILYVMHEPDPTTLDGVEAWTTWYDSLKACRETLEQQLARAIV